MRGVPTASLVASITVALIAAWPSVFAQAPLRQGPPPPRTGTAFVSGRVIEDTTGKPIPDAVVTVMSARPSLSGNLMFVQVAGTPVVQADSQGRYFFASLPAGSYSPRSSKAGYTPAAFIPRAVTLADGQHVVDLDIRLAKLASISGTLRDDAGDPVVATDVIAFRRAIINGRPSFQPARPTRSDDRGAYRISGLAPGDYIVCACSRDPIPFDSQLLTTLAAEPLKLLSLAGRALSQGADVADLDRTLRAFPPTFYPSSGALTGASRVSVKSADELTAIDISLTAAPATRVSGVITGGVSPVNAGQIRLIPLADSDDAAALTQLTPMVVQPDGRFDFANVPPGQYVLRVVHPVTAARDGAPSGDALAFAGAAAAQTVSGPGQTFEYIAYAAQPIAVGPEGARDITVPLRRGVAVNGRVSFEGTGATLTPAPTSLRNVIVLLQPLTTDLAKAATRDQASVSPDGTFHFDHGLPAGRYFFNSTLVVGWTNVKSITLHGVDITDMPIDIGETDPGELAIVFTDTSMPTLEGVSAGTPAPARAHEDRTALIFPAETRFWDDPGAGARRFRTMPVTNEGTFPPIPLPPGEYVMALVPDAQAVDWQTRSVLEQLARGAQHVTIADGQHQTVTVAR